MPYLQSSNTTLPDRIYGPPRFDDLIAWTVTSEESIHFVSLHLRVFFYSFALFIAGVNLVSLQSFQSKHSLICVSYFVRILSVDNKSCDLFGIVSLFRFNKSGDKCWEACSTHSVLDKLSSTRLVIGIETYDNDTMLYKLVTWTSHRLNLVDCHWNASSCLQRSC